jgi:transcriptional regulator with XRE-family HTH domain
MHDAVVTKIKELRKARGLTQKELGDLAGLDHSFISRAERGESELSAASLMAIAAALGVDMNEIAGTIRTASRLEAAVNSIPPELQDDAADILERFLAVFQKRPR